jgi:hypothetical protein
MTAGSQLGRATPCRELWLPACEGAGVSAEEGLRTDTEFNKPQATTNKLSCGGIHCCRTKCSTTNNQTNKLCNHPQLFTRPPSPVHAQAAKCARAVGITWRHDGRRRTPLRRGRAIVAPLAHGRVRPGQARA